jgi:enterobactin synthetase component D
MKKLISIPNHLKMFTVNTPISIEIKNRFESWIPSDLSGAAEKRKLEFISGRYCAFMGCKELGFNLIKLERGASREPLWPSGIIGSISHTDGVALAIVGLSDKTKGIGVDIEGFIPEKKFTTIERMVLTENDKNFLEKYSKDHIKKSELYTIIFSAKEALFKLLFPECQCYFDFREADIVSINQGSGEITIEVVSKKEEMKDYLGSYIGHFSLVDNRAISFFFL